MVESENDQGREVSGFCVNATYTSGTFFHLYFGWYRMPTFLQPCFGRPRQTDCPLNVSKALFSLVMPNAIFVWKDYTRSFPAEKTGLWKMVSENEINHAKVVQGVFEMNIWIWAAKLPSSSSSSFSQLLERVLRAGKQVNGPSCTFYLL